MATQLPRFRNVMTRFFAMSFLMFSMFTIQAQDTTSKPFADVKYLGLVNGKYMVQIEVNNETSETFTIEIKDEKGNQFFHEKFRDKKFKKQFAIEKSEVNNSVNIEINQRGNTQQKQAFTLNATTRIVDYVSVVRM